jgi:hypothetical protein
MIKAAHVAVMAEMLANNNLPAGTNQLEWGRKRVQERFVEVNAMFVIDELVSGVVHAFTGTVYSIASWLPGDTIRTLAQIVNRVIEYSLNYIDEAVFARSFWNPQQNVWENARDGVVLYAMSWRTMLTTAIVLMLISFLPALVVLLLFGAPVGFLLSQISPQLAGWSILLVLFLAWLTKIAIGDTFAIAAILATYQRTTSGVQPDAAMSDKLDGISEQFRDLKRRATEALSGNRGAAPLQ